MFSCKLYAINLVFIFDKKGKGVGVVELSFTVVCCSCSAYYSLLFVLVLHVIRISSAILKSLWTCHFLVCS
jgi:hypothetical protein